MSYVGYTDPDQTNPNSLLCWLRPEFFLSFRFKGDFFKSCCREVGMKMNKNLKKAWVDKN